ncbi:M13 family metallopeptidase [Burkholderia sp. Ax-1719]|uniref:M13 family metallopeptidase n=1 Tax=Burkholderia sp. Ax-1719 TaxID=2608334 RepID=UPI00142296F3|nr:M13 family metallopeptidase [Burkholderia sp. Ax-1719]NIE63793.1 M13 family metallopeptidase [Burkholderia sp. Ax-1719]
MRLLPIFTASAILLASASAACAAAHSGIHSADFDNSVRPQDDLYQYANGAWLKHASIPSDRESYGVFDELIDLNDERLHGIIESAAAGQNPPGSDARKIGDLFQSFMDVPALEKLGVTPLRVELAAIDSVSSAQALARYMGRAQSLGIDMPLRLSVDVDAKDSSRYLAIGAQGGLGLPDRDYYLQDDARFKHARNAYVAYLTQLFSLTGEPNPAQIARDVLTLETQLARAQWSKVENRDPARTYNRMTPAALGKLAPQLDADDFLRAGKMGNVAALDVSQPSYVKTLGQLMTSQPIATWRSYLKARLLNHAAPYLSRAFVDAQFAFEGKALSGTPENLPRWKRGVALTQKGLGEAVGKLYVAHYFPPENKARIEQLVSNLLKAYASSIDGLTWMSPETKRRAQEKLARYGVKVGYPLKWRDYSALRIERADLYGNVARIGAFNYEHDLAKLNQPVDRDEWELTPQDVNAGYSPTGNEIVFPAAILQPPFFDVSADDAVNYGSIGAIIGHEISHGFDDKGSQYDANGNLHNWWRPEDRQRFDALTARLVAQYSAYMPLPGLHINGQLTLGENIADNAGLQVAYKAYRLSLNGREAPVIGGMTGDQRFFIGFAQIWRNKSRDEALLQQIKIDPHSPDPYRALGATLNCDGFYRAFAVKPTDKMYLPVARRVQIW